MFILVLKKFKTTMILYSIATLKIRIQLYIPIEYRSYKYNTLVSKRD